MLREVETECRVKTEVRGLILTIDTDSAQLENALRRKKCV